MTANAAPLVIFDCDGVLVDSEPISFGVLRDTLVSAGIDVSESRAYQQFLGKSMASITRMIADEFAISLSEEHIEGMRTELFARFQAELQPVHGIHELLDGFGYPHCVASSSQPERIRLSLTKTGLISFFEPNIFSATMVKRGKPEPDLFLHAVFARQLHRRGRQPGRDSGSPGGRHAGLRLHRRLACGDLQSARNRPCPQANRDI